MTVYIRSCNHLSTTITTNRAPVWLSCRTITSPNAKWSVDKQEDNILIQLWTIMQNPCVCIICLLLRGECSTGHFRDGFWNSLPLDGQNYTWNWHIPNGWMTYWFSLHYKRCDTFLTEWNVTLVNVSMENMSLITSLNQTLQTMNLGHAISSMLDL